MDKPLTPEELDIIRRLQENENPDASYDPYEPTVEWFTGKGKEEVMPLSAAPEPKRRWIPSKWEKQKVMKIVRAIRQGRIIPNKPKTASTAPQFYSVWNDEPSNASAPLPAPKPRLPGNAESYNPPEEYLPTEEERKKWEETDPEDRERDFLSQKYSALRLVPAYDQFIKQRFDRQLDLYLAPRVQRVKLQIDPESLIPKLPSPSSLRPFPVYRSLQIGHGAKRVRAVSVSPDGGWVVTGDEGGVVKLWEVMVGKEVKRWTFKNKVGAVEWCPRTDISFFAVAMCVLTLILFVSTHSPRALYCSEDHLHFIVPPNLPSSVLTATQNVLAPANLPPAPSAPSSVKWTSVPAAQSSSDIPILTLNLPSSPEPPKQLVWHRKGDYLASVCTCTILPLLSIRRRKNRKLTGSNWCSVAEGQAGVWIHQVSRRHSQAPFKKVKGAVQLVLFHPSKPHFFVAVRVPIRHGCPHDRVLIDLLTLHSSRMRWRRSACPSRHDRS